MSEREPQRYEVKGNEVWDNEKRWWVPVTDCAAALNREADYEAMRVTLEYLTQDIGPCVPESGGSCSAHPWAGVARCSAGDARALLARLKA